MLAKTWWQRGITSLMAAVLVLSLWSCGDRAVTQTLSRIVNPTSPSGEISEVSPPEVIQTLRQTLEVHQPQVKIVSPQPGEVFSDNTVTARFQVQDLDIFKHPELELGPHLHVILDNQPYIAVYDLNEPLVLPDLAPGTHTLRVFASRPWHESFKNEGGYAQTTFHIFTKTQDNNPDPTQPILTYSRPKGSYGAEPILLDFYLTNAPLHIAAQENPNDEIADWRIRCTINGNSFVLDRWQPIYLKGFKPGKNWVQLEFLDEQGNTVKNVFNSTIRLITYEPNGQDTLSKLIRGELSATEARGIVELKPTTETPTPTSPTPTPAETTPTPEPITPALEPQPSVTPQEEIPPIVAPTPAVVEPKSKPTVEPKPGGFFNRFRRPTASPSPSLSPSTLPEIIESPTPETQPSVTPQEETPPTVAPAPPVELEPKESKPKPGGFFNRFRRPATTPSPSSSPPTLPEIIESPTSEPSPSSESQPFVTPQEEVSPTVVPTSPVQLEPKESKVEKTPKSGFFKRFQRPTASPSPSVLPKLPEAIQEPAPEKAIPLTKPEPESSLPATPTLEPTNSVEEPAAELPGE